MLNQIKDIAALSSAYSTQFNASLPLCLLVLEKKQNGKYLLQIGSRKMETNSLIPLQIGARYWGVMSEKYGAIAIKNLLLQPEFFCALPSVNLTFLLSDLEAFFKAKNFSLEYKKSIIEKLKTTQNKSEFFYLANSLLALKNGVLNLVVLDNSKRSFIQLKPAQEGLFFYAIFEHLGTLEGRFDLDSNLTLFAAIPQVADFLSRHLSERFSNISMSCGNTKMLHEFKKDTLRINA